MFNIPLSDNYCCWEPWDASDFLVSMEPYYLLRSNDNSDVCISCQPQKIIFPRENSYPAKRRNCCNFFLRNNTHFDNYTMLFTRSSSIFVTSLTEYCFSWRPSPGSSATCVSVWWLGRLRAVFWRFLAPSVFCHKSKGILLFFGTAARDLRFS